MMLDHPGWITCPGGCARRAFRSGDATWTVVCGPHNTVSPPKISIHTSKAAALPELPEGAACFDPKVLPLALQLAHPIRDSGRLHRLRTPDLWDALLPLVLRHRIRTRDATRYYHKLSEQHGTNVETFAGPAHLPPRPEVVARLTEEEFANLGLRGKADRLRTVANAYLTHADEWKQLTPTELLSDLQTTHYIGKWTAGAAVADITNDFSFYTFSGRPAYAHWQELFTALDTCLTEDQFSRTWEGLDRRQLSALVALVLASKTIVRTR